MAIEVTLAEEDSRADLAPVSGWSASVVRRKAQFLKPRAEADPSVAAGPCRPLLRDLVARRLFERWPPKVIFWGWLLPEYGWRHWVQRLRPVYRKVWRSAGIRDAIAVSTCTVSVDVSVFSALLECWSSETNTFVFPWPFPAEATVTLEDVMLLGGFSVLGESVRAPLADEPGEVELLAWLTAEHRTLERSNNSGRVSQSYWTSRFMRLAGGKPGELEHAAFLALWLSRYVFPAPPHGSVGLHVLPLAVRLAQGARVALAPAVLASIYRDLRLLSDPTVHGRGCAKGVDVWAPFRLLQLWAWERFESLSPPDGPTPLSQGKARAMRWDNLGKQRRSIASVRSVLESPGEFRWRPYARAVSDWSYPSFYCYGDRWVTVGPGGDDDDGMGSYARCLRACELVGLDSLESYAPQRVAMQFGLDQDLPGSIPPVRGSWELAWATYDGGKERVRFYVPLRFHEPGATRRFLDWQRQCALDRGNEATRVAKRRKKREQERRRRLRKKGKDNYKGAGFMPGPGSGLNVGTQEVHGHGLLSFGVEPMKLRAHGDKQRRCKGELLTEDGDGKTHSSGDSRTTKRIRRTEADEAYAFEALDDELIGVKEGHLQETNEQQSFCSPRTTKESEIGMSSSRLSIIEIESDDEELQRRKAGETSGVEVLDPGLNKENCMLSTSAPESPCSLNMRESEIGTVPCIITIIEIESDNEELRRQRDLEFDREIDQLKAEIASLQAMITNLESGAQMEPATIPHLS